MIWWLVVIWLVVVGVPTVYVGIKAFGTMKKANALQGQIQSHMGSLQVGGLATLSARQVELQQNLERLTAAMERLNVSLTNLRMLIDRWKAAIAPLRLALRLFRR